MAVALDATTAAWTSVNSAGPLTVSNLTTTAAANAIVVLLINGSQGASFPAGLTVKWDTAGANQTFTQVSGTLAADGGLTSVAAVYALLAPSSSGNKNITISWTSGSNEFHACAASFKGVDQTSIAVAFPHGNTHVVSTPAASPCTVTITSAANNMVIACHAQNVSAWGAISGTTLASDSATGPNDAVASNFASGAATVTLTAAFTGTSANMSVGCDILAAAGGGTPANRQQDWPNPTPPSQIDRTWTWSQTRMIGKDTLPFRQQDWQNPRPPPWIEQTWAWRQTRMFGQDKLPNRQQDWQNPRPPPWIDQTLTWSQTRMFGQDKLPNRQQDWPIPAPPPRSDVTWTDIRIRLVGTLPFRQQDWPNPTPPSQIDRTWTWSQTRMFGQDKLPFRQQDWPNPAPPPRSDVTWIQAPVPPAAQVVTVVCQVDWHLPDMLLTMPWIDQTWAWNQTRMIGQDKLPFRQQDWPNPAPPPRSDATWVQGFSVNLATAVVLIPHNQFDWPNPVAPQQIDRTWTWSQTRMFGQDALPIRQQDWPNPVPPKWTDVSWVQQFELLWGAFIIPPQPHSQFDWPNPLPPAQIDRFWAQQPLPLNPPIPPPPPIGLPQSNPFSAMHNFGRLGSV